MLKFSVRDLAYIGVFAAVMAVCAMISIPMPSGIAFTLQTFAVALAGAVLGAKRGTVAAVVYVLLGAIGLPIFSGFSGGLSVIAGPTGGFILSFPLLALCAGLGAGKGKIAWLIGGIVVGALVNYACGVVFFTLVMSSSVSTAIGLCVLPYLLPDAAKMALVVVVGRGVRGRV